MSGPAGEPTRARYPDDEGWVDSGDGHDLHCFEAWRRMDEILVGNFIVFHDVVTDESYDLCIGHEAWELDHFLHDHLDLKRAPFAGLPPIRDWTERHPDLARSHRAPVAEELDREVDCLTVDAGGARRAAERIAEVLR